MMQCLCKNGPDVVNDEVAGETLCGACGTVVHEREAVAAWDNECGRAVLCDDWNSSGDAAEFMTTKRIVCNMTAKRCAEMVNIAAPILEYVGASSIMTEEANALIRRMINDGYTKWKTRQTVCTGVVLAVCNMYGTVVKPKDLFAYTGTSPTKVRRLASDMMARYNMRPLSAYEKTKRIISKMCHDTGRPELLRLAVNAYESMVRNGLTTGKNPYTVAAYALGIHVEQYMSKKRFAEIVGVDRANMHRYAVECTNVC